MAVADLGVQRLRALVACNPVFSQWDDARLGALRDLIAERQQIAAGEVVVREGEPADAIFLVESGRLEVSKKAEDGDSQHRLAILGPGMAVGEVALLDGGLRSASVRALDEARVLAIPLHDLNAGAEAPLPILAEIKISLGYELAERMRIASQATVEGLRRALHEEQVRAEMGQFMCRLLIWTCLYMFALGSMAALKHQMPGTTTPMTIAIVIAFAVSIGNGIRTSSFPASAFGLTTRNWRPAVREALLFSIPVAALLVLAKWLAIQWWPSMAGAPLFDLSRSLPDSGALLVALSLLYVVFIPFQEMVARAIQSSLMLYLTGPYRIILALVISALMFSALHLHLSFEVTVGAFALGLFWGWLYLRNPTLVGVSLSHVLLGLFAFTVIGVPA